ncbi:MAG: hypothetical protein AMXMBFR47_38170 [Planctomycetota bacterium]
MAETFHVRLPGENEDLDLSTLVAPGRVRDADKHEGQDRSHASLKHGLAHEGEEGHRDGPADRLIGEPESPP